VCVFSSATPDTAVEAANALHDRALRCVFDVAAGLAVGQGASSVADRHSAEGQHQVRLAPINVCCLLIGLNRAMCWSDGRVFMVLF
jgi:hypothetical protein